MAGKGVVGLVLVGLVLVVEHHKPTMRMEA